MYSDLATGDVEDLPFIVPHLNGYDDIDDNLPDSPIEVVDGVYIDGDEWWSPESECSSEKALAELLRALLKLVARQQDSHRITPIHSSLKALNPSLCLA